MDSSEDELLYNICSEVELRIQFEEAQLSQVNVVIDLCNKAEQEYLKSINKIRTLDDFVNCRRLRELYIRKNDIRDLREIRHLRHLPELINLWLDENPCTDFPEYRMTVLRNLPNLEKLDNVPVQPEEVADALRRGTYIPDSDDEGYSQPIQESYSQGRPRSEESSPDRDVTYVRREGSECSEQALPAEVPPVEPRADTQCPASPTRRAPPGGHSPESEDRYEYQPSAMTRSHYEPRTVRSPEGNSMRHSISAQSVKDYTSYTSNGDCRASVTSPHYHEQQYYERPDRQDYQQVPQRCPADAWERESTREMTSARERDREYPSAVMAEHRGFTRRPVTRNSNLLSAVLCLVKELDYPSLEVAEMAVRCRMDELANSQ